MKVRLAIDIYYRAPTYIGYHAMIPPSSSAPRNVPPIRVPHPKPGAGNVPQGQVGQALRQVANGALPANPPATSRNAAIQKLLAQVDQQESALPAAAAEETQCMALPRQAGHTGSVVHAKKNALECLLEQVSTLGAGRSVIVNAGDHLYPGGGFHVAGFPHDSLPLEETLCVVVANALKSLRLASGSYPLGPVQANQGQLYSSNLSIRYPMSVVKQLLEVGSMGKQRLLDQLDVLLNAPVPAAPAGSTRFDMVTVVAPDRRNGPIDSDALYSAMLRQFAHAMTTARQHGATTFIFPLPGGKLFAQMSREPGAGADPEYQEALARAAADAIRLFAGNLDVVLPSQGRLSGLIEEFMAKPMLVPAAISRPEQAPYRNSPQAARPLQPALPVQPAPGARPLQSPKQVRPAQHAQHARPAPLLQQVRPVTPAHHVRPAQHAQPARGPAVALQQRTLGKSQFQTDPRNLATAPRSAAADVLRHLIGDGSHASLHRVHGLPVPAQGRQAYWFTGRHPDPKVGCALVCIEVDGKRENYCLWYNPNKLPALANVVRHATPL